MRAISSYAHLRSFVAEPPAASAHYAAVARAASARAYQALTAASDCRSSRASAGSAA